MESESSGGPQISLEQVFAKPNGVVGYWHIGWRVENIGAQPVRLASVRLPHGQFKADERKFEPAIELGPRQQTQFQVNVRCREPEGPVTENAFVIFYVLWLGEQWRVFVRLQVAINANGEPETRVELITTQQLGFSGVSS